MVGAASGNPRFFSRSGPYPLAAVARAARGAARARGSDARRRGTAADGRPQRGQFSRQPPLHDGPRTDIGGRRHRPSRHARAGSGRDRFDRYQGALCRVGEGCGAFPSGTADRSRRPPVGGAVDQDASVDPSAEIGPLCVIASGVRIGPGCRVGPCAVIGSGVVVGRDCRIGAHAESEPRPAWGSRLYLPRRAGSGRETGFASVASG